MPDDARGRLQGVRVEERCSNNKLTDERKLRRKGGCEQVALNVVGRGVGVGSDERNKENKDNRLLHFKST